VSTNADVQEGMQVFGNDEQMIGRVDRVYGTGFDVAGFHYDRDSVVRVEYNRVYVQGVGTREVAQGGNSTALANEGELRVPVVEEQLQVGKRDVELGEVEIRRRVVAEEQSVPVTLRREQVNVREVDTPDRPLRPGEDVFNDETIRVAVRGEEAVVAKEAMVTGEVVVEKDVTTEQRQVSDTVLRTEVDFDEHYTRARGDFEAHYASWSGAQGRSFAESESHYRTGFMAGSDRRYQGRSFEEIEPDLRRDHEARGDADVWDRLREQVRTGFNRARQ
jgi:uncharacterized protein (TIGR02271 family)